MCLGIWGSYTDIQKVLALKELCFFFDGREPLDHNSSLDAPSKKQNGLGRSQLPFVLIYDLCDDG